MRNLRLITSNRSKPPNGRVLTAVAWDASDDSLVYTARSEEFGTKIFLCRSNGGSSHDYNDHQNEIASWDVPSSVPGESGDEIVYMQFFSDSAETCIFFAGGDIVVVRQDPVHGEQAVEIVGSVDAGIVAAACAPDQDLLSIVTKADTLILMTRDFEVVTTIELTPKDLQSSKHVSVGWGKKETQFQGKRAKAMRDPTMPETVDEGLPSVFEDGRTTISWRGDGACLALNRVVAKGRRAIRVFTRDGILESVSEPVNGLEGALSWRPSGDLISGVQRWGSQVDVVFFECNGLRHGEFSLRLAEDESKTWASDITLAWNVDSTVLAVCYRDRVHLWTRANYHYYLKQEIRFDRTMSVLSGSLTWHPEKPLKLSALVDDTIFDSECVFRVDRGSTIRPHDLGVVAVIDGKNLKLTPLKTAMVPPPMSLTEVTAEHNIVGCSFSQSGHHVAVLTQKSVEIYKWNPEIKTAIAPEKLAGISFDSSQPEYPAIVSRQVLMQKENKVLVLSRAEANPIIESYKVKDSTLALENANMNADGDNQDLTPVIHAISTDARHESLLMHTAEALHLHGDILSNLSFNRSQGLVEVILRDDRVDSADSANSILHNVHVDELPANCHVFSLSRKGELFADDKVIARGCTSFAATAAHLIFTTSQHLLKFVHLGPSNGSTALLVSSCPNTNSRQTTTCPATHRRSMSNAGASNEEPESSQSFHPPMQWFCRCLEATLRPSTLEH